MQAKALVNTLHDNLPEAEAERHWDILGNIKAEALADPMTVTLAERGAKTTNETKSNTVEEVVVNTLRDTSTIWRSRHWSIR